MKEYKEYSVTGMSCAACSARVEKAVNQVPGVTACSVSLLTNSMGVEGTASPQMILEAVEKAGYKAEKKEMDNEEVGVFIRVVGKALLSEIFHLIL